MLEERAGSSGAVDLSSRTRQSSHAESGEEGEILPKFENNELLRFHRVQKETVDRLNSVENQPESNYVKLSIAATENMRADYTLKSFLRARLYKVRPPFSRLSNILTHARRQIEQFAQSLMEDAADARERLSPMEFRLCETCVARPPEPLRCHSDSVSTGSYKRGRITYILV